MIGQNISHYTILEKLGEGGMGVVYKALDTHLDRKVALKFLSAQYTADPEISERFMREAKAIAALNHPNIITVHEVGMHGDRCFIALEYVDGTSLKDLIGQGTLTLEDTIDMACQICLGLGEAHRAGIVHRDVKPDNILVDSRGHVKITDFGLAQLKNVSGLTQEASTMGTLNYMSPEQVRSAHVDQRSDIFSAGVVVYEMISGHLPFKGDYKAAVTYSILHDEPEPLARYKSGLSQGLQSIIDKALDKDLETRYQHVEEMLADLKREKKSASVMPAVVIRQRSKLPWIMAATVMVLGVAGVYLFMNGSHPNGPNSKTIAVLPFINLTEQKEDEYFTDGMTDDILTQLAQITDLKVISRTTMMRYKETKKSLTEIGKELNAGIVLEGSVRRAGGKIRIVAQLIDAGNDEHLWAETYDREFKEVFTIQSEIARKIASSLKATLSSADRKRLSRRSTVSTEAYDAYLQGNYFFWLQGKENVENATRYFEQALRIDPEYADAWTALSYAHQHQADAGYAPLEECYRKARKEVLTALNLDPKSSSAHAVMGYIKLNYDWDWSGADASFQQALELWPSNFFALSAAASLAGTLGRFEEAMTLDRRVIESNPLSAGYYIWLGVHSYYAGRMREAETALKKALELNPRYPYAHLLLGCVYLVSSKPRDAFAVIEQEPEKSWRMFGLSIAYHALGKTKEANETLQSFIVEFADNWAYQIAVTCAYRQETDKAFEWLDRAFTQRDAGLSFMKGDPLLRNIEKDPRYRLFMKKMNLPYE